MQGLQVLEKYPLSKKVIKDWFMKSMLESFKNEEVPEDFKQFMLEQGIEDDKVAKLIDVNVRILFDVFDENDIYLNISRIKNIFMWSLHENQFLDTRIFNSRKEAEHAAIEAAFEILENKLQEERMNIIAQNGNTGEHYEETAENNYDTGRGLLVPMTNGGRTKPTI